MAAEIHAPAIGQPIEVSAGLVRLAGDLAVPRDARGVVVFSHGSGSGRFSPRNRYVAETLQRAGFATLLVDLLTLDESQDEDRIFDIDLLASRLEACVGWLDQQEDELRRLPLGLFGASTGAGAALVTASRCPERVAAVVSRGGRPDIAWQALPHVKAPTSLIVGECDEVVLRLNADAFERLTCPKEMVIVRGATHLFPEPGALGEVAARAADWFQQHLRPAKSPRRKS
jgi:putative phosphoribosyl transferase